MSKNPKKSGSTLAVAVSFVVGAGVAYFLTQMQFRQKQARAQPQKYSTAPSSPRAVHQEQPRSAFTSQLSAPNDSNNASAIMKYGWPGLENIRSRKGYVASYDRQRKTAHWSCERLTKEHIAKGTAIRSECDFFEDILDHEFFRARLTDYRRSGYDRGHLAAAANHNIDQEEMCETFALSNISPQVGKGFNRDYWASLERYTRELTQQGDQVFVCSGPLYLPAASSNGKKYIKYEVIGEGNVAVPTHFFKAILVESGKGDIKIEAYIVPNGPIDSSIPFSKFRVPLQQLEKASGHMFFERLPNRYNYVRN